MSVCLDGAGRILCMERVDDSVAICIYRLWENGGLRYQAFWLEGF